MEGLIAALEGCLSRAGLLSGGASLICAVSGGADSVALLRAAHALKSGAGYGLRALHVEHGLRGEASRGDEAFVRRLCAELDTELLTYHPALDPALPGVETRAREARRECYKSALSETGADAILLAHHAGDQAETVVMRLLRGSGAGGLSGMDECAAFEGARLIRPFLSVSKADILNALAREGYAYRTDETNLEPLCLRNRVRLTLLPMLRELAPDIEKRLCQTASRMRLDDECLNAMAEKLLGGALSPYYGCIKRDALRAAPVAVAVRALRSWAAGRLSGADETQLDFATSSALCGVCVGRENRVMNLPLGLRAETTDRYVHMLTGKTPAPPAEQHITAPGEYVFGSVTIDVGDNARAPDGLRAVTLPKSMLESGLLLRAARPGDRIRPFGLAGHKALNRYFTDRKLDAAFRPYIPVLFSGGTALWAAGAGASEETRLHAHGADVVQLYARGEMPWCEKE